MSQKRAKCAIYKTILPLRGDVNQPSQLFNFDLDQVLTLLTINTVWV